MENKSKFKKYSKLLRRCIHGSIKRANHQFISNSKNKCKAAWQLIKKESVGFKSKQFIERVGNKDIVVNSPNKIAEAFNDYWINLTNDIRGNTRVRLKHSVRDSIFLKPYGCDEIHRIILSLNNTNSVGYDELATRILKICSVELSPVITFLVNLSFETGCFPKLLKQSVVKPLHKKGNKEDLDNYRPVTLIPIMSKIFETAMHKRLTQFIEKHNILREEQYGFQRGKSTTLACFNLIHTIVTNLDKRFETTGIYFDMSKAFDFVSHKLLLDKLEKYGIRGPALHWIQSYLNNRMQCVEIEKNDRKLELKSYRSKYKHNKAGVPQGGVLSSLLFLLYINDLPEVTNNPCFLFADDISLIMTSNNTDIDKYITDINNTIESIISWLDENNLRVNLTKTNFIQFSTYGRENKTLNINNRGIKIKEVDETTFLGITIDKHCNWKAHVNKVCNKINKFVHVLYELAKTSALETVLSAYYGYVDSVLRYGLITWGYSTESQRAFIAQKKCIRAIAGIRPWESCKPYFK